MVGARHMNAAGGPERHNPIWLWLESASSTQKAIVPPGGLYWCSGNSCGMPSGCPWPTPPACAPGNRKEPKPDFHSSAPSSRPSLCFSQQGHRPIIFTGSKYHFYLHLEWLCMRLKLQFFLFPLAGKVKERISPLKQMILCHLQCKGYT